MFLYWLLERWIARSGFWPRRLATLQQKRKPQRVLPGGVFALIVLSGFSSILFFFFFNMNHLCNFFKGRQVTQPSITCQLSIPSCWGNMESDTLQIASWRWYWECSIHFFGFKASGRRWLWFLGTPKRTALATYLNEFSMQRTTMNQGTTWGLGKAGTLALVASQSWIISQQKLSFAQAWWPHDLWLCPRRSWV